MAREMATLPPLRAYTINILGSLAGVVAFARDVVAGAVADLVVRRRVRRGRPLLDRQSGLTSGPVASARFAAFDFVGACWRLARPGGPCWRAAPSGRRTTRSRVQHRDNDETVVEVNNIFHQSMAPVEHEGILLPVALHGVRQHVQERADSRRRIGHRRGRRAAPRRRARGCGRNRSGDHPPRPRPIIPITRTTIPRVTVINDDARHFLRTSTKKYDLVVFALIDSLTLQSSFSGVRLESYMFTDESFRDVRNRLERRRRARRSTTTSASAGWSTGWRTPPRRRSAHEPRVHVHEARAFLGVLMAGPRLRS